MKDLEPLDNTQPTDTEMSILEHLIELRRRLLFMLLIVIASFLVLIPFSNFLYNKLALPILKSLQTGASVIATDITSTLFAPFKLTFFVALVVAMPALLYHIWRFVSPGLYQNERRWIMPLMVGSSFLFYLGIAFAYFIVLPMIAFFFISTAPEGVLVTPDINLLMNFALTLFLAFGAAFQIPVAILLLHGTGLIHYSKMVKQRPYVIVGCFFIGMILTPPDILSQTLLAIPMILLFEAGIIIARFIPSKSRSSSSDIIETLDKT
ncbi:MAG: twin-arginine translocase subunit TatC [Pseudomonadota bacterium]